MIMKQVWFARDKDGKLAMFNKKPFKYEEQWIVNGLFAWLPPHFFPEIQWSDDEPVRFVIDNKNE